MDEWRDYVVMIGGTLVGIAVWSAALVVLVVVLDHRR